MLKRTLATATLTVLTCGVVGATTASAATTPQVPDNTPDVVQQHAQSVQEQAQAALRKLDTVKLPENSPLQGRVDATRQQLRAIADQPRAASPTGPLCDVVNGVLNTAYGLLQSLGVPNGPDIGLPDFPNPCKMSFKLPGL